MHLISRLIFCLTCLICGVCLGETSPSPITDIVVPHVKVKNATFKDALSLVESSLRKANLRLVNDKVNDVPANYNNTRIFNFDKKNATIADLLNAVIMAFSGSPLTIQ